MYSGPLAPGDSKTYEFLCAQYGTSWYHSHFSAQYGDGILGAIQINGPTTQNYDVDLGVMPIQDWYYLTAYQNSIRAETPGPPPVADNALINGTMKNADGGGAYHKNTITKGKKYKVRLINTSMDNHFKVHLDGHNLTVVSSDLVPVIPYTTDWLFIGIGTFFPSVEITEF
jgi:FtsP/CotA-like multicopper oxidase with cupredoxin domain